jgi:hypothetical protein
MLMRRVTLCLALVPVLSACGPVAVEDAERACVERANLALHPRGEVGIGVNSKGQMASKLELNVSSDYLMGRDPSAVFNACVQQQSGQFPTRPLYEQPGWRG